MARSPRLVALILTVAGAMRSALAIDTSEPAILQWFDSAYVTQR